MSTVEQLADQFLSEFKGAFQRVGNNLAVGTGTDPKTGSGTIEARLTNRKLMKTLPAEYHGVKVNIEVVGVIRAF